MVERHLVEPYLEQISAAGQSITFKCLLSEATTPPISLNRTSTPNRAIPENNPVGITDTIDISETLLISSLKVGVDISHSYRGDLNATLTTPLGDGDRASPQGTRRQRQ
jgi:subtilisin-like proprotein convertase family protein